MALPQNELAVEDYLALPAEEGARLEWVNGQVVAMGGGSPRHALVTANVSGTLRERLRGGTCTAASPDLRLFCEPTGAFFYPDVMVLCRPLARAVDDPYSVTNPVLVVEVLSPSTAAYDRGSKVEHYRRLASVRHILLVDPEARRVTHYARTDEGWALRDHERGAIALDALGIELPVDEVFAEVDAWGEP